MPMTSKPNWPKPVGRSLAVVPTRNASPAERAAALEAEAATLASDIARDLAAKIAETGAIAAGLAKLNGISPEIRAMVENLETDLNARAAALTRLIGPSQPAA